MKGHNTITINKATMMEALQEYFDKRITGAKVEVTNIENNSSGGFSSLWDVSIDEKGNEP